MEPAPFSPAFRLVTPLGIGVAVHLPRADPIAIEPGLTMIHPEERAHALTLSPLRRVTWVGGRVALRAALSGVVSDLPAILSTPRGAPSLPRGVAASISHKRRVAIALAAPTDGYTLGVDVEEAVRPSVDITRHVLRQEEIDAIAHLSNHDRFAELLLRFSIKEAIYKAIDPFVQRYVAFSEVSVRPCPDGTVGVHLALRGHEGPFRLEAWWTRRDDVFIAAARACLARDPGC